VASTARILGGHRDRTVRVRIGQHQFRKTLIDKFGPVCAFTGGGPLPTLEAGHLYSYAETGEHHSDGGLLLRRDIHRLFDLGYLAVNPQSLQIDVHSVTQKQRQWLLAHWKAHRSDV
jgi:hypothetical protein